MNIMEDIPKLYTALAEWLSCMVLILLLKKRWNTAITAMIAACSLGILCVVQYMIGIVNVALWIPGMGFALVVMYGTILLCCQIEAIEAGFYWALAFISAEFAASLEWQLYSFLAFQGYTNRTLRTIFLLLFYSGIFYGMYQMERKQINSNPNILISKKDVFSAVLISVGAFLISNISYVNTNTPFSGHMSMEIFYIRTLVDLAGGVMLWAFQEHWRQLQTRQEAEAIQQLFQRQYEQYHQSQQSIDTINRKYHDLKHQIGIIRMEQDAQKREEYLRQMESEMERFAAEQRTGNPVLDTILTGKKMYCIQNQIQLSVVADGEKLNFIEVMDLCSIFGNALDNAIESAERLPDLERRLIKLAVYSQNLLLMIRIDNYFESSLLKNGEDYETTKDDKAYHGYGIKSIRHVAEKYGGSVSITTEDNWFSLKVLIPIPDQFQHNTKQSHQKLGSE